MKNNVKHLSLFVLLGLPFASNVFANDFAQPGFNGGHKAIESYFSPIKPSNLIQYDNNTGALNTSFTLPLKNASKDLRKNLTLSYSSYSASNTGFGIGFSLTLPRFYKNPNPIRANYILEYKNQVVEYQVDGDSGYEKDLTFFSKFSVNENTFIITLPTGERLTFDKENGNILKEESAFRKANITYSWLDSGHIDTINLYNGTKVQFDYDKCNYETKYYQDTLSLKAFLKGKVVDTSLCATQVNINGKKVLFDYEDGHLVSAYWEGAKDFSLFSAKYGSNLEENEEEYKVYGTPGEETTALKLGAHGVRFIKNEKLLSRFGLISGNNEISFGTNASIGFLKELDINHDGLTDLIIEKIDHEAGVRFQEQSDDLLGTIGNMLGWGDYIYRSSEDSNASIPKFTKKEVYIVLGRLNENKDNLKFYVDDNYKLPQEYNSISPACLFVIDYTSNKPITERCNNPGLSNWDKYSSSSREDIAAFEPSKVYKAALLKNASLLVGDFNGDKQIDILHCSKDSKSIVYGKHNGMSQKLSVDFPCSHHSMTRDLNQDGLADIITAEAAYLNLGNKFEKVDSVSLSPLQEALTDLEKLQSFSEMSHSQLGQTNGDDTNANHYKNHIEAIKDKKITFDIIKNDYLYDNKDNEIQLITRLSFDSGAYIFRGEATEGEYYPGGIRKRLEELTNSLGAKTQIRYANKGASPIVSKVVKNNLNKSQSETLEFYQGNIDPIDGTFLGYKFLRKVTPSTKHVEGNEKVIHFYSDSSKKTLLSRIPIHGKVAETVDCKLGGCDNLINFIKSPSSKTIPLNEAEFINLNKWSVSFGQDLGDEFEKDQYFIRSHFNSNSQKMIYSGQSVFKSVEKKSNFGSFSSHGPLKVISEKTVGINSNTFGTNIGSTGIYEKVITEKKIFDNVVLNHKKTSFDQLGATTPISKTTFSYAGKYGEAGFKQSKEVLVNSNYSEITSVEFDGHGRKVKITSPRGEIEKISYTNDESVIAKFNSLQKTRNEMSEIGEILKTEVFDLDEYTPHMTLSYEYLAPGIMSQIKKNNYSLDINYNRNDSLQLKFIFKKNDTEQKRVIKNLDHFGNTIAETQVVDGKESLISRSDFDASGIIVKEYLSQLESVEEKLHYTYYYDFAGRLTEKVDNILDSSETWVYNNNKEYFKNGKLISKVELMPENLFSHAIRGDNKKISVEDSFVNGIESLAFDNLNLKFIKNSDGSISKVINHDLHEIYKQEKDLFEVKTDDISTLKLNKYGNIQKVEKIGDTYEFNYDQRNRLSSYDTNVYRAKAVYDNDGYLVSNKYTLKTDNKTYNEEFFYNTKDLISKVFLKVNNQEVLIEKDYDGLKLNSIKGFINNIDYDKNGAVTLIEYKSGLIVEYDRDDLGQVNSIIVNESGETRSESYIRNKDNLISNMLTTFNLNNEEKKFEYNYSNDLRFLGKTKQDKNSILRNEFYTQSSNMIQSYKTTVMQLKDSQIRYGVGNKITGVSKDFGNKSYEFLRGNLHYINGVFVRYIEANGNIVGALLMKDSSYEFLPIVTDVRGSLRLVYNSTGELILLKNYDEWGYLDRENYYSKDEIDSYIYLDYAKLKRINPKSDFLLAKHRIYNTAVGEWLTIDPLLLRSTETFLDNKLYEIDGICYAAGDPINFVDPSGHLAVTTAMLIVGGVNAIAMGSAWVATKTAMWANGNNTPQMNAQINKGFLTGVTAGFLPAAIFGGGELALTAGSYATKLTMGHIAQNATFYSAATKLGSDLMSGAFDSSLPSNGVQTIGWFATNRDAVEASLDGFMNEFSALKEDIFAEDEYSSDGFRFYNVTPSFESFDNDFDSFDRDFHFDFDYGGGFENDMDYDSYDNDSSDYERDY